MLCKKDDLHHAARTRLVIAAALAISPVFTLTPVHGDELLAPAETALGKAAEVADGVLPPPAVTTPGGAGSLSADELNDLLGSAEAGGDLLAPTPSSSDLASPRRPATPTQQAPNPQALNPQAPNPQARALQTEVLPPPQPLPRPSVPQQTGGGNLLGGNDAGGGNLLGGGTNAGGGNLLGGTNAGGGNLLGGTNAGGGNLLGGTNAGGGNLLGGNNAGGGNLLGGNNAGGGNLLGGGNNVGSGNLLGGGTNAGGGNLLGGNNAGGGNLLGGDLLGGGLIGEDNLLGGSGGDPLGSLGPAPNGGVPQQPTNPLPGVDTSRDIGPAPIQPYRGYNPNAGASQYNPHAGASQYNPHAGATLGPAIGGAARPGLTPDGKDPHEAIWTEHEYPSADTCRQCHPKHFEEWRASSHAYASISPMFNRFEQAMIDFTKGTVGHFCIRCHSPVATQLKLDRTTSILDMPPVVREGVTCIACHRVNEHYGRSNGDRRIEPGDIHAPVGAPDNAPGLWAALADAESLKLKTDASQTGAGQKIHNGAFFYKPLNSGDVCTSCHQVAVHPGIWLEVVHSQYRAGPAHAKGIKCQECHMGAVPGKPYGYEQAHIAEIGGKKYGQPRRHANHNFWGPGYSIAHPGVFPHNPKARQFSPRQWMDFDYRSGWGTDAFEDTVTDGTWFPEAWQSVDDRIDARRIVDANIERAQEKRGSAAATLEAGINIAPPRLANSPRLGRPLKMRFDLTNISEGHNFPTASLGAQPQSWLNVVLIDPDGCRVWETGYLDTKGDLADMHSEDVANGIVPADNQLFNLQTKFLINNGLRGTDREVALPVNFSIDQLPFLRPGAVPVTVLNHPPLIRMEAHSIPPLGTKTAKYKIPGSAFSKPGAYRLSWRMRCRTEPMYFMRLINCPPDMIRRMNENMQDIRMGSKTILVR